MKPLSIGLLDFGYRSATLNSMMKLSDVVEYAVLGEALGYDKFWLGEHHMPRTTLPWNDPALVIPVLAAHTQSIHLGTAGTLLCIHQPYQVASTFKFYSNVYRNRIDLGFANGQPYEGVARQSTGKTSMELMDEFDRKVSQTVDLLRQEDALFQRDGIIIPPYKGVQPRLWTLGGSAQNLQRALDLKTNVCIWANNQFDADHRDQLLNFKKKFRAIHQEDPHIRIVILGICHRSDRKARAIASFQEEAPTLLCGSAQRFHDYICQYQDYYGIDEFMFFNSILEISDRMAGVEKLREQLQLATT